MSNEYKTANRGEAIAHSQDNDPEPSSSAKLTMKYENFFEIIKFYPCLFNKSQTPKNKTIKQNALQAIQTKIENIHGIKLSGLQVRKKLENMKMRAKAKRDQIQMGDLDTKFKYFEEELLKLMDYKKNSMDTFLEDLDPESGDVSVDSSKHFKYEVEDEMPHDEEVDDDESEAKPSTPPEIIPGAEIKSEINEIRYEQMEELNTIKDSEILTSHEEDHDFGKTEGKINPTPKMPTTKSGIRIRECDFFDIIKCHGCLFERSQAPHVKAGKQEALQTIRRKLKSIHGIHLSNSQIRKKINNMKERVKGKLHKSLRRNSPKFKLKSHERQLLQLTKFKKVPDNGFDPNTSDESNEAVDKVFEDKRIENNKFNKSSVLSMQKEVLIEQKELNRQQIELNILQKEVLTLKKEKLQLEIDLLKKKQNT